VRRAARRTSRSEVLLDALPLICARRRAVTPEWQLAAAQLEAIDVESLMLDDVFRDVDASIASLAESHAATRRT